MSTPPRKTILYQLAAAQAACGSQHSAVHEACWRNRAHGGIGHMARLCKCWSEPTVTGDADVCNPMRGGLRDCVLVLVRIQDLPIRAFRRAEKGMLIGCTSSRAQYLRPSHGSCLRTASALPCEGRPYLPVHLRYRWMLDEALRKLSEV